MPRFKHLIVLNLHLIERWVYNLFKKIHIVIQIRTGFELRSILWCCVIFLRTKIRQCRVNLVDNSFTLGNWAKHEIQTNFKQKIADMLHRPLKSPKGSLTLHMQGDHNLTGCSVRVNNGVVVNHTGVTSVISQVCVQDSQDALFSRWTDNESISSGYRLSAGFHPGEGEIRWVSVCCTV